MRRISAHSNKYHPSTASAMLIVFGFICIEKFDEIFEIHADHIALVTWITLKKKHLSLQFFNYLNNSEN